MIMRLTFGVDDSDANTATTTTLVARFERWLGEELGLDDAAAESYASDAGVALDWKWSCADGDLGTWRAEHLTELLLEWCPRKLSVPATECRSMPVALVRFFRFLEAQGLLGSGSSPLPALERAASELTEEFVAAMGDPSKFGMAKSLFTAAGADGVDLSDPSQLDGWIADFNARSESERREILPDSVMGGGAGGGRPALPPVALPEDAEVAAAKAEAAILVMFARMAEFVGDGRKLTQKGNLTLADARALVELLGTGDVIDHTIGDRTFKTTSAAELPGLRLVFAWAKKAGVVRVSHGKILATKRGVSIAADPVHSFDRAVDALLSIGPLRALRDPSRWMAWPDVDELLDQFLLHLLSGPYVAQRPVPLAELASIAGEAVLEAFVFDNLSDDLVQQRVAADVVDIVDVLCLAGMMERVEVEGDEDGVAGGIAGGAVGRGRRRFGGSVLLTAAGVDATRRLLIAAGYDAPAAGQFADASATDLLTGTDLSDFPTLWGEVEAWRRRREPSEAVRELAEAAVALDDPALRQLALAVMADIDSAVAEPAVRKLAIEPAVRGFALCWLVDQGLEEEHTLFDSDDIFTFVDVLAHRLVTGGPDALIETLALVGSHESQIGVISQLWRSRSSATVVVLTAIGQCHPTRVVAKSARKAAFKCRSRSGQ